MEQSKQPYSCFSFYILYFLLKKTKQNSSAVCFLSTLSLFNIITQGSLSEMPDSNSTVMFYRQDVAGVVYRRVQGLEEDLEKSEEKLVIANQKLDKVKRHGTKSGKDDIWTRHCWSIGCNNRGRLWADEEGAAKQERGGREENDPAGGPAQGGQVYC